MEREKTQLNTTHIRAKRSALSQVVITRMRGTDKIVYHKNTREHHAQESQKASIDKTGGRSYVILVT